MMLDRFELENEMEHDPTSDRNREPAEPDNNMNVDEDPAEDQDDNAFDEDDDAFADDEFGPQEFSALNNQLDQLQSALDSLESRNDDIHSKLLELLRSSREIRQGMIDENSQQCVQHSGEDKGPDGALPGSDPAAGGSGSSGAGASK